MSQRKLPRILEDEECEALLGIFNTRYDSGLKNRCMVRVMLEAGLRVSELTALKPEHLNMTTCRLDVKDGKGGKDRMLWVKDTLRDDIGAWLERRPAESAWLFCTRTANATNRRSVHRTVQNYAEKAGIRNAGEVSPHTLRHTFATQLYRETKNIRLVQKALGHNDLSTTMIYTHIVDDELEDALRAR